MDKVPVFAITSSGESKTLFGSAQHERCNWEHGRYCHLKKPIAVARASLQLRGKAGAEGPSRSANLIGAMYGELLRYHKLGLSGH